MDHGERRAILAGALLSAGLLSVALASRFLGDRVPFAPESNGLWDLLAFPASLFLIAAATFAAPCGQSERRSPWISRIALALALWCAGSWFVSDTPHTSRVALLIVTGATAAGFVAARIAAWPAGLAASGLGIAGSATVVAAIGVHEYARSYQSGNTLWRVFATFVNPDFLAGFLVVAIPVTAGLCLGAPNRAFRLLLGAAAALQAACLLLTQSRLGVASLAVGAAVQATLCLSSGDRSRPNRKALGAGAVVLLGVAVLAAGPLIRRIATSGGESYSAAFRIETWRGTLRGAADRPVLGSGIGSFDTAYPRRAILQYTQHAHNSFVQLALETGFPGATLFLTFLAGLIVTGIRHSLRARSNAQELSPPAGDAETETPTPQKPRRRRERTLAGATQPARRHSLQGWAAPAALQGVVAGLAASVLHNVFDSDLYLPANALAFALAAGIAAGLSGSLSEGTANPRRSRAALVGTGGLLLLGGGQLWFSRQMARAGEEAARSGHLAEAVDAYRSAIGLDRSHPDLHLGLAQYLAAAGKPSEAEAAYRDAVAAAPIGRTHYRYGRFLAAQGRAREAIPQFEAARDCEPGNMQNLVALADAYRAENRLPDAERLYLALVARYKGPFGSLRAVPELVDWEIGEAYAVLAEAAAIRGDTERAAAFYEAAAGILGEFWRQRSLEIAVIRVRPEIRTRTADRYAAVLGAWMETLRTLGREREADDAAARLSTFREERAAFGETNAP